MLSLYSIASATICDSTFAWAMGMKRFFSSRKKKMTPRSALR
jgi:hypothetical protein